LLALITNKRSIEETLLVKLNNILKLAIEVRALELPIYLHTYFWDEEIKNEIVTLPSGKQLSVIDITTEHLNEDEIDAVASFLYSKSYKCLPYDKEEKVLSEIVLLLKSTHNALKINNKNHPPLIHA
jgi:hypothetical protein